MIYTGKNGKKYDTIEPPIGRGGEGSVYKIKGDSGCVLKVFNQAKRTETRHRKLLAMISTPLSAEAMKQVTWPMDVVYESGQFVGYIMPAIQNNEDLNVMYSDKYSCSFADRIVIARNLCVAINAVHVAGQVCGDLNPKNIGVDPKSARITLVDTDSYHITDKATNRVYRCEVGMPEYLPKEIQEKMKNGYNLANAPLPTFTKESDLFALAVHIFALLMNGCHPYACAVNNMVNISNLSMSQPSVTAPQPIDNICNGFFPFYTKKSGITIPMYAPEFTMLPKKMQDMFVRAFVEGGKDPKKRPDTVEWYNVLTEVTQNVKKCKSNKSHIYPSHLNKCPWCEIEQRMNPTPTISAVQTTLNRPIQQQPTPITSVPNQRTHQSSSKTMSRAELNKWVKVIGWIVFVLSVVYVIYPILSNGFNYYSLINAYESNLIPNCIAIILGSCALCFCDRYAGGVEYMPVPTIPILWCAWNSFISSVVARPNDYLWLFGCYTLGCLFFVFVSMKIGSTLGNPNRKNSKNTRSTRTIRKLSDVFTVFEIVFMCCSLAPCLILIPMFIKLEWLYGLFNSIDRISLYMWIIPIIVSIMFVINQNSGSTRYSSAIDSCFCSSVVAFFQLIITWARLREYAIIWFVALMVVWIVFVGYAFSEGLTYAGITTFLLVAVFFFGVFGGMFTGGENGRITNGLRLAMSVPTIVISAISVKDIFKELYWLL